ncbi:MAG: hypothetical protein R3E98_17780 [Gemmatimonadota bacterium]|nr:hypothetical protein [Gemmatimonadota bacterium]
MRLPHPSRLLGRDYLVLVAHKAALESAGRAAPPAVDRLFEQELDGVALDAEEDLIALPYFEVAEGRYDDPSAYRLVDPPFTGPVLSYPDLLERQVEFWLRTASSALTDHGPAIGGVASVLATAVLERRVERGEISAKVLVELLHQHRWSAGASMTAELFHEAMLGAGSDGERAEKTLSARSADPRFIEARMDAARRRFEDANEAATSLTDWAERLYLLRPHLEELSLYLLRSELEGTERRLGLVLHLKRLAGERLRALAAFAEARVLDPAHAPLYFDADLEALRSAREGQPAQGERTGVARLEEALDDAYRLDRRVPRFWYEAAKRALRASPDPAVPELAEIDPFRLLSLRCLEEWSAAWDERASIELLTDPEAGLPKDFKAAFLRGNRPVGAPDRDAGPPPPASRLRLRDHQIVQAGVRWFSLPGFTGVPSLWSAVAGARRPALEPLPFDEEFLNVPRLRARREDDGAPSPESVADPPWTGDSWPYLRTLELQRDFWRLLATCPRADGQPTEDEDLAFHTLGRLVWEEGEAHGTAYARGLVERWHAHRWAPGTQLAGLLLYQTMRDPNHEASVRTDERGSLENNGTLINARIKDLQARLQAIKESVTTLTEWAEALYRISPHLHELRILLDLSEGANAEAWLERFQRIGSDIIDVGALNLQTVLRQRASGADVPTWTTRWIDEVRTQEGSLGQAWKRLDQVYREQVVFPKFWYELAVQHLDTPLEKMPPALTELDPLRVVSIDVLECWSAQLINAPRDGGDA